MLSVNALECVRGERRLFADLSFELAPHTLLEVRGANGSGKTSLLRMLCGLLAPAPAAFPGTAPISTLTREEYRAQLGLSRASQRRQGRTDRAGKSAVRGSARPGCPPTATATDAALRQIRLCRFSHHAVQNAVAGTTPPRCAGAPVPVRRAPAVDTRRAVHRARCRSAGAHAIAAGIAPDAGRHGRADHASGSRDRAPRRCSGIELGS